jgi:hypothetical protein
VPAFDLLWPTLSQPDGFRCVTLDGRVAVLMLGACESHRLCDVAEACRLHHALECSAADRGLLVVF